MSRIAVDQSPSGGDNFPFRGAEDVGPLLLDVFLGYEDGVCEIVTPLRIAWMYGFGTDTGTPSVDYTPTHDRDMVIVDAFDTVVFNSTEAESQEVAWGADRAVVEWYLDDQVLRVTYVTSVAAEFDDHIEPDAVLDPRTYSRLPERVVSLQVGEVLMRGDVVLDAGYNVQATLDVVERVDGGLFVERILLDGVIAAGAGRLPGCEEVEPELKTINNIGPDKSGNFLIESDDCIRQRLLLGSAVVGDVTVAEYAADAMTSSEAEAGFQLVDNCTPCCPCDYTVYTYRGMNRVWAKWASVAAELEAIRDMYGSSVIRWNEARECRLASPLSVVISPQAGSNVFVGAAYCNMSHCCVTDLTLVFTFSAAFAFKEAYVAGTGISGEIAYAPEITDTTLTFRFDSANPQSSTTVRLRVCLATGTSVSVTVVASAPQPAPNADGEVCVISETSVTKTTPLITAAPVYPCTSCGCP